MGAIPEEIDGVVKLLSNKKKYEIGNRNYYTGEINNQQVVVVFSRIGKVAAATTVSTLIIKFNITELIFTGVAGAIDSSLKIGDIVLAKNLVQHDMDAEPLFPKFEIPLLKKSYFDSDQNLLDISSNAIKTLLEDNYLHQVISVEDLNKFDIHSPKLHIGLIASGDLFFSTTEQKDDLQKMLPDVLCVEMEGAAVAQVCYEFGLPFTVIRTISDEANESATVDFTKFIEKISNIYSIEIIKNIIK